LGPDRLAATCATIRSGLWSRRSGDLKVHSIAGNDEDSPAPSHLAGYADDRLTGVIESDPETGIGKGLDHGPLGPQDHLTLGHLKAVSHPHIMGREQTGY
jgi:hypothetical protein